MSKKNVIEQMIGLLRTPIAQRKGINIPSDECLIWAGELEKEFKSLISNSNDVQNPADKVEPKFHEGDWIVFNGLTLNIKEVVKGYYKTTSIDGIANSYDWGIDNIARLWVIQDAKDGDVLAAHECIVLFKEIDGLNIKCHCTYHFMNNPSFYVNTLQNKSAFHPAAKEQRELLFQKMREAGYTFDFEKNKIIMNVAKAKFKIGDWIVHNRTRLMFKVVDAKPMIITVVNTLGDHHTILTDAVEENYHLWSIKDARDGDVLVHNGITFIFKGIEDGIVKGLCSELSDSILNFGEPEHDKDYYPATKEQRDLILQKMHKAGYTFDFEKKELKKIVLI